MKLNQEQIKGPEAVFRESVGLWKSLVLESSVPEKYRTKLNLILESLDLNNFVDKKLFWERAHEMARLSMVSGPELNEVSNISNEILRDMIITFQKISGEDPAIRT